MAAGAVCDRVLPRTDEIADLVLGMHISCD